MRLKFINPDMNRIPGDKVFINPAYWMMKSYYLMRGKYPDKIEWLDPVFFLDVKLEELEKQIIGESPDILCISLFVWNKHQLLSIAETVRKHLPNCKIIAGGPSVEQEHGIDNFKKMPYLDYLVYGDGERAFQQILDSLFDGELTTDAVNIITPEHMYPHKVFSDAEFAMSSPWLTLQDEVKRLVEYVTPDCTIMGWEMARGCPYACSFCDWSAGLHHKVKRRRPDWKAEIDFFKSLDVYMLYVNDANWGFYPEDLKIHRYAVDNIRHIYAVNLPKKNKRVTFEILKMTHETRKKEILGSKNMGYDKVSLQDIIPEVLSNIDRPEIPWSEHKKMIKDFLLENPNMTCAAELMIGLPGQTEDSWLYTLSEVEDVGFRTILGHLWTPIPNSPAYKPAYIAKHGLVMREMIHVNNNFDNMEELHSAISENQIGMLKMMTLLNTNDLDLSGMLFMKALADSFSNFKRRYPTLPYSKIIPKFRYKLKKSCDAYADQMLKTDIFAIEESFVTSGPKTIFSDTRYLDWLLKR
jgi:putative methyltransferase